VIGTMRRDTRTRANASAYYTTCIALAILFLFPLVWSGWSSVRGQAGSAQASGYGLGNYRDLIHYGAGLRQYFQNSLEVSAITVVGTVLVSLLGGYAFARFRFRGRNALFLLTLAILMVPYPTMLIPLYILLRDLHLQGGLLGLGLVFVMFQLPFATFMMRTSFEAVPKEVEESAMVDGCSTFGALFRVIIHSVRPGLITVGLFAFLSSWNDFVAPLILINDGRRFTLPVAIYNAQQQAFGVTNFGALEAGVVVMATPCVALFLFLQRHYVRGFMSGAIKG
jgi:multiple sugar transport system permease protein